jgi:hypothetical protein
MKTARRITAIATVVAVLMLPVIATSASASPTEITGTTSDSGWRDTTLAATATVGLLYTDSIRGPASGGPYSIDDSELPDGLSASIDPLTEIITVSGTPSTAGPYSFTISYSASNGENHYSIDFTGFTVEPDTLATTTTVTTAAFSPYTGVNLNAAVSSNTSGGTVNFYLDSTLVGSSALTGVGTASYTGAVPASFVGSSPVVKAVFSGSSTYASSTSTSDPTVYIYGARVISGAVLKNGEPVVGTSVSLLNSSLIPTGALATTDPSGLFTFVLGPPATLADAQAGFALYASDLGLYYSTAGGWKQMNVTFIGSATIVHEADWNTASLSIYLNIYPTWTDQLLAQPRLGETYSDSVVATTIGTPSTITYSLTGDPLPSWLSFANGTFTSAGPADQLAHTFTVRVDSTYGWITKEFTLQAGDAGVAPVFTDTEIPDLQVGTELTDGVAASGDPTIVYSSTALPAGLTLNSATGAITGTPTTAGDYTVTFTATNDFGDDTFLWEPTVAAAPEISLVLNFAADATIEDADTEIGADGLKVGSTYTLYLHSAPVLLYTGTVDATGAFSQLVTLPANTPVGAHELILTGIAPDGTVLTAHAWFTLLPNGRIGAISYSGPLAFTLAFTGSEPIVPLGIASALLLAGFLALRRRQKSA